MALIEGIGDEVTYAALFFTFLLLLLSVQFFKYCSTVALPGDQTIVEQQRTEPPPTESSSQSLSTLKSNPNNTTGTVSSETISDTQSSQKCETDSRNQVSSLTVTKVSNVAPLSRLLIDRTDNQNSECLNIIEDSESDNEEITCPTRTESDNEERTSHSTESENDEGTTESDNEGGPPKVPVGNEGVQTDGGPRLRRLDNSKESSNQRQGNEERADRSAESEARPNQINVRLKYLDDTERIIRALPTDTILDVKSNYFAEELNSLKIVRLIRNGQLLRNGVTLQDCGISEGAVVHVHISSGHTNSTNAPPIDPIADLDISAFFYPLFTLILGLCWVFYIRFPEFFNVTSIILLITLSVSFVAVYVYSIG